MFTDARFVPKRSVFASVSLGTIQIFTLIQIGLVAACLRRADFFFLLVPLMPCSNISVLKAMGNDLRMKHHSLQKRFLDDQVCSLDFAAWVLVCTV